MQGWKRFGHAGRAGGHGDPPLRVGSSNLLCGRFTGGRGRPPLRVCASNLLCVGFTGGRGRPPLRGCASNLFCVGFTGGCGQPPLRVSLSSFLCGTFTVREDLKFPFQCRCGSRGLGKIAHKVNLRFGLRRVRSLPPSKPTVLPPPSSEGGKRFVYQTYFVQNLRAGADARPYELVRQIYFVENSRAVVGAKNGCRKTGAEKQAQKNGRRKTGRGNLALSLFALRLYNKCWGNQVEPALIAFCVRDHPMIFLRTVGEIKPPTNPGCRLRWGLRPRKR